MNPKFKVGDVVRLKSGGPKMTIDEVYTYRLTITGQRREISEPEYFLKWFDEKNQVKSAEFSEGMLENA